MTALRAQRRRPELADGEAKDASTGWRSPQWWPALAGIAFAAFVALDLFRGDERGGDLASIVVASGLVYLAAAATRTPSIAWWTFLASIPVITVSKIGWIPVDATWLLLALAGLFLAYGLLRRSTTPARGLPVQTIAMAGFGAVAAVALYINEVASAYLVAAGLLAHALWDRYHHWANKIVTRSLAEFCFALDILLAAAILVVTMRD